MGLTFGSGVSQLGLFWTDYKAKVAARSLSSQFIDDGVTYLIFAFEDSLAYICSIWKGDVPDGVVQGGYTQVQNDADKADFNTNYKARANHPEPNHFIPSKIVSRPLKNGSVANMAVNGSSTPQIFSFSSLASKDVLVKVLCLMVETSNAISFGNKFIDSTIATLTNGLLLEAKADDESYTLQNCKRTRDLIELVRSDELIIITGTPNFFRVSIWLPEGLLLTKQGTYSNDDYIQATVRDDLRAITYMEMFYQGVKL